MKKILITLLTSAAAILAVSCQKEKPTEPKGSAPMTITAVSEGIGTATKAQMVYKYDVVWSKSDKIYVTDGTTDDTFTISDGVGTTKGTFTQDGTASLVNEVQAYYPSTMVQNSRLMWPDVQTKDHVMPMYSKKVLDGNGAEDFSFSSLGAVIQIAFSTKSENVVLKTIKISDASKKMCGAFAVDDDGKAVIASDGGNCITLDLGDGVAVGVAAKYFNIAIPAGDYKNLTLRFTADDGRMCVMNSTTFPTVERNTVGKLTLAGSFENDIQAVDLGLSVKWANVNLGASKPEDYGDYFAWGETSTKDRYSWNNYKFYNGVFDSSTGDRGVNKYCNNAKYCKGEPDYVSLLSMEDDAARANWGGSWRIPSYPEMEELMTKCRWDFTTINGVQGFKVTGTNGNYIFIPAAGNYTGTNHDFVNRGCYWTNHLIMEDNQNADVLYFGNFDNGASHSFASGDRADGKTIRPVLSND